MKSVLGLSLLLFGFMASASIVFNPADLNNPNDWKRQYFDLVVVINRNAGVQTLDAYYQGNWLKHVEISSAVEAHLSGTHLDGTPYTMYADTPLGYYPVTSGALKIDHHSTAFDESYMPFAVFFNQNGGIATHEAPPGSERSLGTRASHGCVRLPREDAIDLFFMVALTGGPVQPSSYVGECPEGYRDQRACLNAARTAGQNDQALAHAAFSLADSKGISTYPAMPSIPQITLAGQLKLDPKTGMVLTQPGFKTLYIVEDVALAAGASKTPPGAPIALMLNIPLQEDRCVTVSTTLEDTWGKAAERLNPNCYYEPSGPPD